MGTIETYEILDHGVEHAQYFQGCGTSLSEYADCATGIGDTAAEALEDALEQLACGGWETESVQPCWHIQPAEQRNKCHGCECVNDDGECLAGECELWHYVSVRVG